MLKRLFLWIWRRLGDIQTGEWLWNEWVRPSGISAAASAAVTGLGLGHLHAWQLILLAVTVFALTMFGLRQLEGWRYLREERKLHPWARLGRLDRTRADNKPPAPPGIQPEHIRRDLDGLIQEGEEFFKRRLSITAAPLFQRMVPEGIWSAQVIEWRNRSIAYLKQAGLESGPFAECSPSEVKTLTGDQVRCHIERLRESL